MSENKQSEDISSDEKVIKNIPEKIYLILGLDKGELFDVESFNELHEVSWCTSKEFYHDIEYVLAAPLQKEILELKAEIERLKGD